MPDKEFTAAPRHEYAGVDRHPKAAELRPPEHLLKWQPGNTLRDKP